MKCTLCVYASNKPIQKGRFRTFYRGAAFGINGPICGTCRWTLFTQRGHTRPATAVARKQVAGPELAARVAEVQREVLEALQKTKPAARESETIPLDTSPLTIAKLVWAWKKQPERVFRLPKVAAVLGLVGTV